MIKTYTSGDEVEVIGIIEKKPSEMSQDLEKAMSWYEEWRDRAIGKAEAGLMDQISEIRAR